MEEKEKAETQTVSYRTNLFIWLALVVLTGLTVYIAGADLLEHGILLNILIASCKASLVLYVFMHLKYEPVALKVMLFFVILTFTSIILLTFMDILYRY